MQSFIVHTFGLFSPVQYAIPLPLLSGGFTLAVDLDPREITDEIQDFCMMEYGQDSCVKSESAK